MLISVKAVDGLFKGEGYRMFKFDVWPSHRLNKIFCLYFEDHTLDKTTCYEVLLLNHLPVKVLESKTIVK